MNTGRFRDDTSFSHMDFHSFWMLLEASMHKEEQSCLERLNPFVFTEYCWRFSMDNVNLARSITDHWIPRIKLKANLFSALETTLNSLHFWVSARTRLHTLTHGREGEAYLFAWKQDQGSEGQFIWCFVLNSDWNSLLLLRRECSAEYEELKLQDSCVLRVSLQVTPLLQVVCDQDVLEQK